MKPKLLTTLTAALLALSAWANFVKIDGIYYDLDSNKKTASVTNGVSYKGDIIIPASVTYDGTTYSVTSIKFSAFHGCQGLTSINIPESVTSIGSSAFFNCTGLTSVTIPESVTSIGDDAFGNCTSLKKVCITDIAAWCGIKFANLGQLSNPLYYARHLYLNNEEVTELTIPSSVTSISVGAFINCSLTSITIPNSVTSIGNYAFNGCGGLTSITIPNSVTSIGYEAFYGCTGLTSITIPNSVTFIGYRAFAGCIGLSNIKVAADNTKYDSRDNCNAIIETASNTLIAGCMNTTIPNSVTSIGWNAFYDCTGLTSITIPNSVTSIGNYAFYDCTGLTSITIPNSVNSIGEYAFRDCTGLEDIYALRTDPAAYDCATDAFSDYSATLHVPAGSKEAYASTETWSNFANIVEEEDLTAIQPLTLTPSEAGESYYNLQGQRIAEPQRGQLVVVRRADGTSRKVVVD